MSDTWNWKWILGGAIAGTAAAGALALGLFVHHHSVEQEELLVETEKLVTHQFSTCKLQIIRNMLKIDTIAFDMKTLLSMYKAFHRLVEHPEHGVLTYKQFSSLLEALRVQDTSLIEPIFNLWDRNHNKSIDFLELVIGMSTVCKGSTQAILQHFFDSYDFDNSGDLSRKELKTLVRAMNPFNNDSTVSYMAQLLWTRADKDGNHAISRTEWLRLADDPTFDLEWIREFHHALCKVFGLDYEAYRPKTSVRIATL